MNKSEILGRVLSQTEPEKAKIILSQFKNILKDPSLVEKVFEFVEAEFSEEDMDTRKLLFIGSIYQLYQPLSFLRRKEDDKASGKLPIGVRDEIQRCLGVNNPETVNSLKYYCEPYLKPESNGVIRPFKVKVMRIVEEFKKFSIHPEDTQYQLFGA